jgi:hypothetical protein
MSPISVLWTPDWNKTLSKCIKAAKKEVFLVSPWLKLAGAELILNALQENSSTPKVNLLTTFNESELIGANLSSDLKAYCLLLGYDVEVRVVRGLHAKIYICDYHDVIVSSGNLTAPGLGLKPGCNLEIALHISDPNTAQEILEKIQETWETSEILTLELLRENVERIQATNTDYIKSLQETSSNEENGPELKPHGPWWSGTSSNQPAKFNLSIAELINSRGDKPNFKKVLDACETIQKQFEPQQKQEIVFGSEPVENKQETEKQSVKKEDEQIQEQKQQETVSNSEPGKSDACETTQKQFRSQKKEGLDSAIASERFLPKEIPVSIPLVGQAKPFEGSIGVYVVVRRKKWLSGYVKVDCLEAHKKYLLKFFIIQYIEMYGKIFPCELSEQEILIFPEERRYVHWERVNAKNKTLYEPKLKKESPKAKKTAEQAGKLAKNNYRHSQPANVSTTDFNPSGIDFVKEQGCYIVTARVLKFAGSEWEETKAWQPIPPQEDIPESQATGNLTIKGIERYDPKKHLCLDSIKGLQIGDFDTQRLEKSYYKISFQQKRVYTGSLVVSHNIEVNGGEAFKQAGFWNLIAKEQDVIGKSRIEKISSARATFIERLKPFGENREKTKIQDLHHFILSSEDDIYAIPIEEDGESSWNKLSAEIQNNESLIKNIGHLAQEDWKSWLAKNIEAVSRNIKFVKKVGYISKKYKNLYQWEIVYGQYDLSRNSISILKKALQKATANGITTQSQLKDFLMDNSGIEILPLKDSYYSSMQLRFYRKEVAICQFSYIQTKEYKAVISLNLEPKYSLFKQPLEDEICKIRQEIAFILKKYRG